MTIVTIVGARPQFIKAAPLSKALRSTGIQEILLHTGQHYDAEMSDIFFDELGIPTPDINLEIGSGPHGQQTGRMLEAIEKELVQHKPDKVLVYGDTNSTLAGALAAAKLNIPVAHIEAGLRSFNTKMPEEHNRVLTDHCSTFLFCPTPTAVDNLSNEGIIQNVHLVGDPMLDATLHYLPIAEQNSTALKDHNLDSWHYFLATLHRPSNVDNPATLIHILETFDQLSLPVLFPVHPRTKAKIDQLNKTYPNIIQIPPVGYLDMLKLLKHAKALLTDSGGLQKEALFLKTPCITLREETEWLETLVDNANQLTGPLPHKILQALAHLPHPSIFTANTTFGDGTSAEQTAKILAA
jgi:UDP-GlcNAc3NAcA epimerase